VDSVTGRSAQWHEQVAKIVHCGLLQDSFEACALCANLLRPQDLEETEHFRRWRQEKVAKIVHWGANILRVPTTTTLRTRQ